MKKKILIIFVLMLTIFGISACGKDKKPTPTPPAPVKLDKPENLKVTEEYKMVWDSVEGAAEYVIVIGSKEYKTTETTFDLSKVLANGTFTIWLSARGNTETHLESDKASISVKYQEISKSDFKEIYKAQLMANGTNRLPEMTDAEYEQYCEMIAEEKTEYYEKISQNIEINREEILRVTRLLIALEDKEDILEIFYILNDIQSNNEASLKAYAELILNSVLDELEDDINYQYISQLLLANKKIFVDFITLYVSFINKTTTDLTALYNEVNQSLQAELTPEEEIGIAYDFIVEALETILANLPKEKELEYYFDSFVGIVNSMRVPGADPTTIDLLISQINVIRNSIDPAINLINSFIHIVPKETVINIYHAICEILEIYILYKKDSLTKEHVGVLDAQIAIIINEISSLNYDLSTEILALQEVLMNIDLDAISENILIAQLAPVLNLSAEELASMIGRIKEAVAKYDPSLNNEEEVANEIMEILNLTPELLLREVLKLCEVNPEDIDMVVAKIAQLDTLVNSFDPTTTNPIALYHQILEVLEISSSDVYAQIYYEFFINGAMSEEDFIALLVNIENALATYDVTSGNYLVIIESFLASYDLTIEDVYLDILANIFVDYSKEEIKVIVDNIMLAISKYDPTLNNYEEVITEILATVNLTVDDVKNLVYEMLAGYTNLSVETVETLVTNVTEILVNFDETTQTYFDLAKEIVSTIETTLGCEPNTYSVYVDFVEELITEVMTNESQTKEDLAKALVAIVCKYFPTYTEDVLNQEVEKIFTVIDLFNNYQPFTSVVELLTSVFEVFGMTYEEGKEMITLYCGDVFVVIIEAYDEALKSFDPTIDTVEELVLMTLTNMGVTPRNISYYALVQLNAYIKSLPVEEQEVIISNITYVIGSLNEIRASLTEESISLYDFLLMFGEKFVTTPKYGQALILLTQSLQLDREVYSADIIYVIDIVVEALQIVSE